MKHTNDESLRTHAYLADRWRAVGRRLACCPNCYSYADWESWKATTTAKLRSLIGYDTMASAPLAPRVTEQVDLGDHVRERIEIDTEPGVTMPLYALIPKGAQPPYPVVIAPHGHGGGGKAAVAGIRDDPQVAQAIDVYNYAYGLSFVRAGFITFCPDARGFGERREALAADDVLASSCQWINNMALPLGQTVTGMWTWDLHRLIDYVETREDCDAQRLGCAGLSGGGLQTLWAAALDERIRCAVISGYMYGYRQSLLDKHGNCSCNYIPHLWEYVDMGDIGALIAPRPTLIESGDADDLNGADGLENVRSQIDIMRRSYDILGCPENLAHKVFHGPHRWGGAQAVPWMRQHLGVAL